MGREMQDLVPLKAPGTSGDEEERTSVIGLALLPPVRFFTSSQVSKTVFRGA